MVSGADKPRCIQCTLVGDAGTGKTTLAITCTKTKDQTLTTSTLFENYAGSVRMINEDFIVSVFDCSSQDEYVNLRTFAYKDSNVFVMCYSVTSRPSYHNITTKWLPEIINFLGKKPVIVLVATQIDLRDSIDLDGDIPVSRDEGRALANDIGADCFLECSSTSVKTFHRVLTEVVSTTLRRKKKKSSLVQRILGI